MSHFEQLDNFKFISHNEYYSYQEDLKQMSMNLLQTLSPWWGWGWGAKNVQVLSNWESKICQDACILEKPCILIFKFTSIWIFFFYLNLTPSNIAAPAYPGDHDTCTHKFESTLYENDSTRVQLFWPICCREDNF